MEDKVKHLEFIQNIITRMNNNSFAIKNWTIVFITASVYLYLQLGNNCITYIIIPVIPIVLFWFLDAYYLWQERIFIRMYNDIAINDYNENFRCFEIPFDKYRKDKIKRTSFLKVFFSKTICPLYIVLLIGLSVLGIVIN
jgi:hypothetical protein